MPIVRSDFAEDCAIQARRFGVNPHYLLAAAQLRSGIAEDVDGDRIGPFRLTQVEWDANSADAEFGISDFLPTDVSAADMQCVVYALMTLRAQNRLLEELGRYPSAAELYAAQWPADSRDVPKRVQQALDATAALAAAATAAVEEQPADVGVILQDVAAPTTPASPRDGASGQGEELFIRKAPQIMERLIHDFHLAPFQAAGIVGNIGLECDGFRAMQELHPLHGGPGGFGWCQWTGVRRSAFETFCATQGLDRFSDAANYGYLKRELETTEKPSLDTLKATGSLVQAVHVFEQKFERAQAGLEHFDRRERWAKLALDHFSQLFPESIARLLDPDLSYRIVNTAIAGSTSFWVVDQFAENGGQTLISQRAGHEAEIIDKDTSVLPIKDDLIPERVPAVIAKAFAKGNIPVANLYPRIKSVPAAKDSMEATARVFAKAVEADETLVTRNVPNTNHGRLACAYAVNEIVRRALGKSIGGGLSTMLMGRVLAKNHIPVDERQLQAGMIIISPTQGGNVGHVGIVGALKNPLSETAIYSNSSGRGVVSHTLKLRTWKAYYGNRKGLAVSYFTLKPENLGG